MTDIQQITILVCPTPFDDAQPQTVDSPYSHGGLAVTPFQLWSGESSGWTITHIASGLKLGDFETVDKAQAAIALLLHLADWTQGEGELKKDATLEDRVDAALEAITPKESAP